MSLEDGEAEVEDGGAVDGHQEERSKQANPSTHQHQPDIDERDEEQANASSVKQSAIPSECDRSGEGREDEATLKTPNKASAQRKTDGKRSSKKRTRDSESKQGSVKKRKETHEKS